VRNSRLFLFMCDARRIRPIQHVGCDACPIRPAQYIKKKKLVQTRNAVDEQLRIKRHAIKCISTCRSESSSIVCNAKRRENNDPNKVSHYEQRENAGPLMHPYLELKPTGCGKENLVTVSSKSPAAPLVPMPISLEWPWSSRAVGKHPSAPA